MFGAKIPLFKLFGFQVNIDLSWFFILILVTWTLATGYFPPRYEGLAISTYWKMGLAGALGSLQRFLPITGRSMLACTATLAAASALPLGYRMLAPPFDAEVPQETFALFSSCLYFC